MNPTQTTGELRAGERMGRAEFDRRAELFHPGQVGIELLEGVVYIMSPINGLYHGQPQGYLLGWLMDYEADSPGTAFAGNASLRLDDQNEPEPDAVLFINPDNPLAGARWVDDGYIAGSPELVIEVSYTTVARDLNIKLPLYESHGIREYLVWRSDDGEADWFVLRDGKYTRIQPGDDGVYRSETFPGLWLDPAALAAHDTRRLKAKLREGIASPEHAAFVAELQQAKP